MGVESGTVAVRYDTGPLGTGKNWVTKADPADGLGSFIRAIAHALIRSGHSESGAIQLAVGVVKRWASGGGHVTPKTRAKAAEAVAHWEAIKGAAHARSDEEMITRMIAKPPASGPPPKAKAKPAAKSSGGKAPKGDHAPGHKFYGNQHTKVAAGPAQVVGTKVDTAGGNMKVAKPTGGSGSKKAGAAGAAATQTPAQKALTTAQTHAAAVAKSAAASVASVEASAATAEALAQSAWANAPSASQNGALARLVTVKAANMIKIKAAQDAQAVAVGAANDAVAQAQAVVDAQNARDDGFMGEGSSAGLLLPSGPSTKQDKAVQAKLTSKAKPHRFKGSDLTKCTECGKPVQAAVHRSGTTKAKASGQPIPPVPRQLTTRSRGASKGHRMTTAYVANNRHVAAVEGPLATSLRAHFQDQRQATVNRLMGKRGSTMFKRAGYDARARKDPPAGATPGPGASGGPGEPIVPPVEPVITPPPSISSTEIFDPQFWADRLAQVLGPHLNTAASLAQGEVKTQLGLDSLTDDASSIGAVQDILERRAHEAAQSVTNTTGTKLAGALQAGVAAGEGRDEIAQRVNDVFDEADKVRATQIAQTQTVGAYNEAGQVYADNLPPDIVGSRVWLAHDDDRTRPTHRAAHGQERTKDEPYDVGGAAMMFPGDTSAPIGEWINCRCSQMQLPPGMSYSVIAAAAKAHQDALASPVEASSTAA